MTTTPNMGLVLPDPGVTPGEGTAAEGQSYADLNDAAFVKVDLHDHSPGNGVPVPTAGIGIDADLDIATFSITNAKSFRCLAAAPDVAILNSWQVNAAGEAIFVDGAGNAVQLTNAGSLNASLLGGITGDYSTSNADLSYDDTAKAYELKQDVSPDHWANAKLGELHLHEPASGIINSVRVQSPLGLAASYDWVMPAALPGATEILTMSATGVVDHTDALSVASITATGDIDAGGDIEGGELYFTDTRELALSAWDFYCSSHHDGASGQPNASSVANFYWEASSGNALGPLIAPLSDLPPGCDITRVRLYYHSSTAVGTWQMEIVQFALSTAVRTVLDSDSWTSLGGSAVSPVERDWTVAESIIIQSVFVLVVTPPASANTRGLSGAIIDYSRPST